MTIDKKLEDGKLTMVIVGRIDTNTSPDLEAALELEGVKEIVFDFAGVEYISSAGLRVLMTAQKAMMACGGTMKVRSPNAMVRGVFEITGLGDIFNVE